MWRRVLRSAHLAIPTMPYAFSRVILSETVKSNCAEKRIGESARWADLAIRLVVKSSCMSARRAGTVIRLFQFQWEMQ